MARRKKVDQIVAEVMRESLPDFDETFSSHVREPLRTAAMFVAAYVSAAELTPKRDLETIVLAAKGTGTDFVGRVLHMLSELCDDLPKEQQAECKVAIQLGVQASILFNVADDESDRDLVQALISCYAAMLDPELR